MRDDYLSKAREIIPDVYVLVNVVSRRVKQLRRGARPLVQSLEKLEMEDIALREIGEGRISYELAVIPPAAPSTVGPRSQGHPRQFVSAPKPKIELLMPANQD